MSKTFKKEFLYQKDASTLLKQYNSQILKLQKLRNEIELILKKPLEDSELEMLANKPHDFIRDFKEKIRAKFQFKDASPDFNLQTLGISYDGINEAINNLSENDYKYKVIDDRIQPLDSEIERLKDSMKVYTKNQKQNDILKVCKDLCSNFSKLNELSPIGGAYHAERITNNSIKVGYNEAGTPIPVVNFERIEVII